MAFQKSVVVTGASKGIGRALSIAFSRAGWRIFLVARNEDGLRETQSLLAQPDLGHTVMHCDIGNWDECCMTINTVKELGGACILINNAFGYGENTLLDTNPETIKDFYQTSAIGNTQFTKAMLPILIAQYETTQKRSHIINIVADWGFPMQNIITGTAMYVAGKYLMHGLGVALHREIAPLGVDVTNVYPGIVASEASIDTSLDEVRAKYGSNAIPLKDLASVVVLTVNLESAVIRHLVLSPENPIYNGE